MILNLLKNKKVLYIGGALLAGGLAFMAYKSMTGEKAIQDNNVNTGGTPNPSPLEPEPVQKQTSNVTYENNVPRFTSSFVSGIKSNGKKKSAKVKI